MLCINRFDGIKRLRGNRCGKHSVTSKAPEARCYLPLGDVYFHFRLSYLYLKMMESIGQITIYLGLITSGAKGILHIILDYRNGYTITFASAKGYIYFLPYDEEVSEKDEKMKHLCNIFQKLSVFFLIVFILAGLTRTILNSSMSSAQKHS